MVNDAEKSESTKSRLNLSFVVWRTIGSHSTEEHIFEEKIYWMISQMAWRNESNEYSTSLFWFGECIGQIALICYSEIRSQWHLRNDIHWFGNWNFRFHLFVFFLLRLSNINTVIYRNESQKKDDCAQVNRLVAIGEWMREKEITRILFAQHIIQFGSCYMRDATRTLGPFYFTYQYRASLTSQYNWPANVIYIERRRTDLAIANHSNTFRKWTDSNPISCA